MKQFLLQFKSKRYRACPGTVIIVMLMLCSCSGDDGPSAVKVAKVEAVAQTQDVAAGGTLQLDVTISPEDATNREVRWSSSDPSIATVDQNGLVKAITPGEVTITVTSGEDAGIKDSLVLNILKASNAITSFTINDTEGIIEGTNISVFLTEDADITKLSPEITHSGAGIVPASGEEQDFTEPVTYTVAAENGDTRKYTVTVAFVVSAIALTAEKTEIEVGTKTPLTARITPESAEDKTITWSSSNTSVAVVDEEGTVTGLSKGEVVITATSYSNPEIKGSISVTVTRNDFVTTWNTQTITIPTHPDFAGAYNYKVDWDNDGIFDQEGITGNVTHTFDTGGEHTIRISGDFPAVYFYGSKVNSDVPESIIAIEQWGTIAWQSMKRAFVYCSNLNVKATDAPNLSHVENMSQMFAYSGLSNPDFSHWDTGNVTNMSSLFKSAVVANPDVSNWDTGNVTDMGAMFHGASNANPDVSNWNTGNVRYMTSMFARATSADPDVSNWDTGNVVNIAGMFSDAASANPDVSNWNTGKVLAMTLTFSGATNANPDVSNWNTANVSSMNYMFRNSGADPDLSKWNISKVTGMSYIFHGSGISRENYEKALIRFAAHATAEELALPQNLSLGNIPVPYCGDEAETARQLLVDHGWSINDQGKVCD